MSYKGAMNKASENIEKIDSSMTDVGLIFLALRKRTALGGSDCESEHDFKKGLTSTPLSIGVEEKGVAEHIGKDKDNALDTSGSNADRPNDKMYTDGENAPPSNWGKVVGFVRRLMNSK
ncbi:hypothetical protein [Ferrimonas gelatinilytica]|uniref:Uncharacterized protein n=1 Tax=Ferrimonas gelatinilytica TaxID=1255257 RepID=A0ABP9RZU0_9GAMM